MKAQPKTGSNTHAKAAAARAATPPVAGPLSGAQRRYLRGLAHGLEAVVFVGQKGLTPSLFKAVETALQRHELIKVRFVDFKEKSQKQSAIEAIAASARCQEVGCVGHVAIFFRQQQDPEKRHIVLPDAVPRA